MRGVTGVIGAAIRFDGIDDAVGVNASASLLSAAGSATIELWVRWAFPVINDYQRLLMTSNTFAGDGLGIEWGTNPQGYHYYYPSSAGGTDYVAIQQPFVADTWYHLALTQDFGAKVVRIFVDGVEQTPIASGIDGWTQLTTLADWYWGGAPPRTRFIGTLDEIRVSNVVRSNGWIATGAANQKTPRSFYRVIR